MAFEKQAVGYNPSVGFLQNSRGLESQRAGVSV